MTRPNQWIIVACAALTLAASSGIAAAQEAAAKPSGAALPEDTLEPFNLGSLTDFSTIIERPLFSRDRRLPAATAFSSAAPVVTSRTIVERGRFQLAGVVILGDTKYALLKQSQDADYARVEEGASLHNWHVDAIQPGRVILSQNGVEDIVELAQNVPTEVEKRQSLRKAAAQKRTQRRTLGAKRRAAATDSGFVRSLGAPGGSRIKKPGEQQPQRPDQRGQGSNNRNR